MGNKSHTRPVSWRHSASTTIPSYVNAGTHKSFTARVENYGYTRVGNNVPFFRSKIRAGLDASGALNVQVSDATADDFSAELTIRRAASGPDFNKIDTIEASGVKLGVNLPLPVSSHFGVYSLVGARAKANRLLQQIFTRRRRQVSGIVFAGELGEAIRMVLRPAKTLRNSVGSFQQSLALKARNGRLSGPKGRRVLADTWLEYAFGWQPLLADVEDGAKALARVATRDALERQQFRAHAMEETPVSITGNIADAANLVFGAGIIYSGNIIKVGLAEVIYYGKFMTKLQDSSALMSSTERLIERSGFSLPDIIPSAWELVPWSFFIDYFSNVGDVLEQAANINTALIFCNEVNITTSEERREMAFDYARTKSQFGGGPVYPEVQWLYASGSQARSKSSFKTVVRLPAGDLFPRQLSLRLPVGLQWLNIAALFAGGRPPDPFT